jgi:hypothetical protein
MISRLRKIAFARAVLIAAAAQPLRVQQTSSVIPTPAPGATAPAPVQSNLTYGVAGGETPLPSFYNEAWAVCTGSLAASHPTMPPATSATELNPLRCSKLAAMDER